jgi:hypothetical protein
MCFKIKRPIGHRKNTTILVIGITSLRIELGYANGVDIFHTGGLKDADQKLWCMGCPTDKGRGRVRGNVNAFHPHPNPLLQGRGNKQMDTR